MDTGDGSTNPGGRSIRLYNVPGGPFIVTHVIPA